MSRARNKSGRFTSWTFHPFEDPDLTVEEQQQKWEEYLDALADTGEYAAAADAVEANPREVHRFRRENGWFQSLCDIALQRYTLTLTNAAHTRAVDGVARFALGGKERDQPIQIGYEYSDKLLELALRRRDPTWSDPKAALDSAGVVSVDAFKFSDLSPQARRQLRILMEIIKADREVAAKEQE
jgi:hypothetical protein